MSHPLSHTGNIELETQEINTADDTISTDVGQDTRNMFNNNVLSHDSRTSNANK